MTRPLTAGLLRGLWDVPLGKTVHGATQLRRRLRWASIKASLAPMKPQRL